jgi:uncharacterized protein YcgI (DUF1989 family)
MVEKRCGVCYIDVSKTNWGNHIKTKKHLEAEQERREVNLVNERSDEGVQIKLCGICNTDVNENDWIKHLKSPSHKRNTKLFKDELKEKVRLTRINNRRTFHNIDFETNDYIVYKTEEALE